MAIEDKQASLMREAQALKYFFNITSDKLKKAFEDFAELYESPNHVDTEEFTAALDVIDGEIEDLCLSNKITDIALEARMEMDENFESVTL